MILLHLLPALVTILALHAAAVHSAKSPDGLIWLSTSRIPGLPEEGTMMVKRGIIHPFNVRWFNGKTGITWILNGKPGRTWILAKQQPQAPALVPAGSAGMPAVRSQDRQTFPKSLAKTINWAKWGPATGTV